MTADLTITDVLVSLNSIMPLYLLQKAIFRLSVQLRIITTSSSLF